ncbi:MAG: Na+/H+ antiporter subunit E [Burkholderiales bacterium]|nr:Na+/H+ antiporter subunit E [Burkholderiales bacterium]
MSARSRLGTALARAAGYFALWVVLIGLHPIDLAVGVLAAAAAAWTSVRLLPPDAGHVRFVVLVALLPRFLGQSVLAGFDVARRAFHPRMPLKPGFVEYPANLPRGPARSAFETITSLLPGTMPCGEGAQTIEYHCLDVGQPVVEQLAADERAYGRALVPGRGHG